MFLNFIIIKFFITLFFNNKFKNFDNNVKMKYIFNFLIIKLIIIIVIII